MSTSPTSPVLLLILDGFGHSESLHGNAVRQAKTPNITALQQEYPHTLMRTSGEEVGLPEGQMGNSEVGHLNIGAGRVVYQDMLRITKAIRDGSFFRNEHLLTAVQHVKKRNSSLHLLGLLSDGGVHSLHTHLYALLGLAKREGLEKVYIHAFTDGRDTSPTGGAGYVRALETEISRIGVGQIATLCGRYYAMDRDNRWERTEKAYRALTMVQPSLRATNPSLYLEQSYAAGTTDEFLLPAQFCEGDGFPGQINSGDAIVFFNFRSDRARQLTKAFTEAHFQGFPRKPLSDLSYICMTQYNSEFDLPYAFAPQRMDNILGAVLEEHKIPNIRMAETEKYPHVTFFFNGGREEPFDSEERILVPSPKVATYDLKPEMSVYELTEQALKVLSRKQRQLLIVNYANPDMVGHTGVFNAAIKAVEACDTCAGKLVAEIKAQGGKVLIIADHGNAEKMIADDGTPHTAHTTNPVPVIYIDKDFSGKLAESPSLCDVAPTLLGMLGIPQPPEMTGRDMRQEAK